MAAMKHVTLYGDAQPSPLLDKYDTIIVSPGVYSRLSEEQKAKAAVYFSFFSWARYEADDLDWQPGPGDLGMPEVVKLKGGKGYIYQINNKWAWVFCKSMYAWASQNAGKFQRIFMDDWQISHSWWGIPGWVASSQPGELRQIMQFVEQFCAMVGHTFGSGGGAMGDPVANSQEPADFQWPDMRWYVEGFGDEGMNPALRVLARDEAGMFIQVNGTDPETRKAARALAGFVGGSVGMQPNDGVLGYTVIEDPDGWA